MSGATTYTYDRAGLDDPPQTYAYSAYTGTAFVDAWRGARDALLAAEPLPPPGPCGATSGTAAFLDRVVAALHAGAFAGSVEEDFGRLLRNFEAKKRVFGDYAPGFTSKGRSDARDLFLYVRFAEALALAAQYDGALPWLNGLLKCVDLLAASRAALDEDGRRRLAWIAARERALVDALAGRLGVTRGRT